MQSLLQCENRLGWVPGGLNIYKARATMHHILSRTLRDKHYTHEDFALAVALCAKKKIPCASPLQVVHFIPEARTLAADTTKPSSLDERQGAAIAVENRRLDDDSTYWIGRITRARAEGLAEVLTEWQAAGRDRSE